MDFAAPTAAVRRTAVGATSKMGGFSSRDLRTTASPRRGPPRSRRSRRRHRRRCGRYAPVSRLIGSLPPIPRPLPTLCFGREVQKIAKVVERRPELQRSNCVDVVVAEAERANLEVVILHGAEHPAAVPERGSPSCRARLRDRCPRRGPGSCPSAVATSPSGTRRHSPGWTTGRGQRRCQTNPRRRRTFRGRIRGGAFALGVVYPRNLARLHPLAGVHAARVGVRVEPEPYVPAVAAGGLARHGEVLLRQREVRVDERGEVVGRGATERATVCVVTRGPALGPGRSAQAAERVPGEAGAEGAARGWTASRRRALACFFVACGDGRGRRVRHPAHRRRVGVRPRRLSASARGGRIREDKRRGHLAGRQLKAVRRWGPRCTRAASYALAASSAVSKVPEPAGGRPVGVPDLRRPAGD